MGHMVQTGAVIRKTCPCNIYPLKPQFYIEQMGYTGVYLFFLFLLQNINCGYLLEQPRRGSSNMYLQSMFCLYSQVRLSATIVRSDYLLL